MPTRHVPMAWLVFMLAACGGKLDRDQELPSEPPAEMGPVGLEGDAGEEEPPGDGVQHQNLGLLRVLVPKHGVSLERLSYRVHDGAGSIVQRGEAPVSTTLSHDPSSGGFREDLTFSISLPPGVRNVLDWNGTSNHLRCEGVLGPFAIEGLRTVTFLSQATCLPYGP